MILLTPGPCMTSERVRLAAAGPDLNHRDPEFLQVVLEVREGLSRLAEGLNPCLVGGSGTAAMEAAVSSCIGRGPVLILTDGYFSERMADLLAVHKIPHKALAFDWLKGWDLDQVRAEIDRGGYEWVVMTHHETTTGRLNPIETVAIWAQDRGARVMVDAISSLGADPLPVADLDVVIGSANKGIQGIPGVSFVLTRTDDFVQPPRSYYLDLARMQGVTPRLTPPVPALLALTEALRELEESGGQEARGAKYRRHSDCIRLKLTERGYSLPVARESSSCSLVLAPLPSGSSFEAFSEYCMDRGYQIYGAKGSLAEGHFQASTMGELTDDHIAGWLDILPRFSA